MHVARPRRRHPACCKAALELCTAGRATHPGLLQRAAAPAHGASRWNEGKIHLGYLYAADPSPATRAAVDGGLVFGPLTGTPRRAVARRRDVADR